MIAQEIEITIKHPDLREIKKTILFEYDENKYTSPEEACGAFMKYGHDEFFQKREALMRMEGDIIWK